MFGFGSFWIFRMFGSSRFQDLDDLVVFRIRIRMLDLDFFGFSGSGFVGLDLDSVSFVRILASIVIQRCSNVLPYLLFLEHLLFSFDVWFFLPDFWI